MACTHPTGDFVHFLCLHFVFFFFSSKRRIDETVWALTIALTEWNAQSKQRGNQNDDQTHIGPPTSGRGWREIEEINGNDSHKKTNLSSIASSKHSAESKRKDRKKYDFVIDSCCVWIVFPLLFLSVFIFLLISFDDWLLCSNRWFFLVPKPLSLPMHAPTMTRLNLSLCVCNWLWILAAALLSSLLLLYFSLV